MIHYKLRGRAAFFSLHTHIGCIKNEKAEIPLTCSTAATAGKLAQQNYTIQYYIEPSPPTSKRLRALQYFYEGPINFTIILNAYHPN